MNDQRPPLGPVSRVLIAVLRGYQAWLSPLLGAHCRFEPSCSQYAVEAVQARGPLRGIGLTLWRLLRCNPFNAGGCDPVRVSTDRTAPPAKMRCFT